MKRLLMAFVGLVLAACPPSLDEPDAGGPSDAGLSPDAGTDDPSDAGEDSDAGEPQDAGVEDVCAAFDSTCAPQNGEAPFKAVDRCGVCGRGVCDASDDCLPHPDPHPLCEAGEETALPSASAEDGERPLALGVTLEIDELDPPTCETGFIWTLTVTRAPGDAADAQLFVGADTIDVNMTDQGPVLSDGEARLVHGAQGLPCLPFGPADLEPEAPRFVVQLIDADDRRSPRLCGDLALALPDS